jgi:hypothetical protein
MRYGVDALDHALCKVALATDVTGDRTGRRDCDAPEIPLAGYRGTSGHFDGTEPRKSGIFVTSTWDDAFLARTRCIGIETGLHAL